VFSLFYYGFMAVKGLLAKAYTKICTCAGCHHHSGYVEIERPRSPSRIAHSCEQKTGVTNGSKQLTSEHLRKIARDYLGEHQAETAEQDDRWRARVFKELGLSRDQQSQLQLRVAAIERQVRHMT
jgi:hypothetical protein